MQTSPRLALRRLASSSRKILCTGVLLAAAAWLMPGSAQAHGDVVPHAVDTHTLPTLGEKWLPSNPFSEGAEQAGARAEALRIGTSAYNQNCARCHGLEAISGGIAPNLRKLDRDCMDMTDETQKMACYKETDEYFLGTVRRGRVRDGRVYMPPFEGILNQEAIWSIKTYLETRRSNE